MDKKLLTGTILGATAAELLLLTTGAGEDVNVVNRSDKIANLSVTSLDALMAVAASKLGVEADAIQSYTVKRVTRTVSAGTDAPAEVTEYGIMTAVVDETMTGTEYLTAKAADGTIKVLSAVAIEK